VANPLTGILSDAGSFLVDEGAKLLGFDDERQVAISQEAVDLTNQMVDAGLIGKQYRVELLLQKTLLKELDRTLGLRAMKRCSTL